MNHIYKVVWNRTRACWQVVSELAKNNGRAKSTRRRCLKRLALGLGCALAVNILPLLTPPLGISPFISTVYADTVVGDTVVVNQNETKVTTGLATGKIDANRKGQTNGLYLYNSVIILSNGRWQPDDATDNKNADNERIQVNELNVGVGGIVDLSYHNTHNLSMGTADTVAKHEERQLYVTTATLANGTVFRLSPNSATTTTTATLNNNVEKVVITNAVGNGTIYIQLGYDETMGDAGKNRFNLLNATQTSAGGQYLVSTQNKYAILTITNGYANFTVEGQTSLADAPLYVYEITPYIYWDAATGIAYFNGYEFVGNTNRVSESVKATSDVHRSLRNLWRIEENNLFNHLDTLHQEQATVSKATSTDDDRKREGAWVNTFRGSLTSDSGYDGRSVKQDYDGIQVGYDKRRAGDFYNGKLYTGIMFNKITADSAFLSGTSDLSSEGLGLYSTWVGNKGHYLDLIVRGSRLTNDYSFYDSEGNVKSGYNTWAMGLSSRYGYRQQLKDGWFWEPQVGLSYGNIPSTSYTLSNYLNIQQEAISTLTGRLGVTLGKTLGEDGSKGNVYAKATAFHTFGEDASVRASYAVDSLQVATADGSDTWYQFNLGTNLKLSPDSDMWLELGKTTGGKVRTDWQVSGGLAWKWGGLPSAKGKAVPMSSVHAWQQQSLPGADIKAAAKQQPVVNAATAGGQQPATAKTGTSDIVSMTVTDDQSTETAVGPQTSDQTVTAPEPATPAIKTTDSRIKTQPVGETTATGNEPATVTSSTSQPGEYVLPALTVEAPRPNWEQNLSPGTVSVVYPEKFKGEAKKLPEMLETVPGIHINRVNGIGQYTTATIRGSSSAQVDVYVDGVLMNRGGDAAVDLSLIPVENVARIEVYRGYIPARFASAAIGGVINIVTKKPEKESFTLSQGVRSFGGYQGSLEYTAPLGSGSLLVGVNRDQSDGDFSYTKIDPNIRSGITDPADRHRKDNSYQNTDGVIKWQDANWLVKAAWTKTDRYLPASTSENYIATTDGSAAADLISTRRHQVVDQQSLLMGRRQTVGNLEWGWQVDWLQYDKDYTSNLTLGTWPGALWSSYGSKHIGTAIDGTWKLGDSHLLEFRADYAHETMDVSASDPGGNTGEIYFIPHYQFNKYHFHLQDNISLNSAKNLTLSPIIRAERIEMSTNTPDENKWKYSYGVGLKKEINEHWTLKSSYGTYNRFPNFYEIFGDGAWLRPVPLTIQQQGVGKPTWEESTQFDLGATWRGRALNANANFGLTYFHRDIDNMMLLFNNKLAAWYGNYGSAVAKGLEFDGSLKWQCWDLDLAATWTDTERRKTQYKQVVGGPIPDIPEWEGNIRLTYRVPGDKLSLFAEDHYTGTVNKTYEVLNITNLGFRYNLNDNWKLTGGVNDLFNRGPEQTWYYDGYGKQTMLYPQQGRTYYLTTQYRF